jgi:hypothetical protein
MLRHAPCLHTGRRLQLARGGPVTQKIQKDIIHRLDELIKRLEDDGHGPYTPGQPRSGDKPTMPKAESDISNTPGSGEVIVGRIKKLAARWGSLPEKERRKLLQDLTRGMADKHAQAIQNYFNRMSAAQRK